MKDNVATEVEVKQELISDDQKRWIDSAISLIDEEAMRQFNLQLTSIHSPTGYEREANQWLVSHMQSIGLNSFYQSMDSDSGNAIGTIKGTGDGSSLMLYAPVDTHLDSIPSRDVPWVGPELRPDMKPEAYIADNGDVIGLGSSNPKGMITAIAEAVRVIKASGAPLKGDLIWASCGGGMPSKPDESEVRQAHGLGSGVSYMINHGVTSDFGIIVKPGWAVSWEEVGLCWFKVTVNGQMGYAGMTRSFPGFRNSVVHASKFILELEKWLPEYQAQNTSGLCSPQGAISAVRAGWPNKPSFPSAVTEIYIDMRCTPRQTPSQVKAEFANAVQNIVTANPDLDIEWEMIAAYPAGHTDPSNWIIQSSMRGWEFSEGSSHKVRLNTSGQTDASAIRNLGIPLARIGFPPVPTTPEAWQGFGGMGVSYIPDLIKVTKALVYTIVDTCTREKLT